MNDELVDPSVEENAHRAREETAKCRQILDGARDVFLNVGFDAASMNEIARAAGVSKGTLYVYFDSKEALFENLIRDERRMQAERVFSFDEDMTDIRSVLTKLGLSFLDSMTQPTSIAHVRTVIAVASKFPQIGRAFYEAGPSYGIDRLAQFLRRSAVAGRLEVDDPSFAATLFMELCLSRHFKKMLFCAADRPTQAEIVEHIDGVVRTFLRAYGNQGN